MYLHPITSNRVSKASLRTLQLYRAMCGEDYLHRSVVVMTMWDLVDKDIGGQREAELKSKDTLFKSPLDNGARFYRHADSHGSDAARTIVRAALTNSAASLRIQQELVLEKRTLSQTAAGGVLIRALSEALKERREEAERVGQPAPPSSKWAAGVEPERSTKPTRKGLMGVFKHVFQKARA